MYKSAQHNNGKAFAAEGIEDAAGKVARSIAKHEKLGDVVSLRRDSKTPGGVVFEATFGKKAGRGKVAAYNVTGRRWIVIEAAPARAKRAGARKPAR